jgi:thiamine-phosphate diphosphorylase
MITDRHRAGGEERLLQRVAAAARAGVHLVQVRERDLDGGPLMRLVEQCVSAVQSTRTRIIVNDRLDVALAARAHGVHLRGDSMAAARVRSMAPPGFIVGRSVHARDEAIQAAAGGGLDYMVFGAVFPTASKPARPPAGLKALADVVAVTPIPVLAVGGITAETAVGLGQSRAAGFAAIGVFLDGEEHSLHATVRKTSDAFDGPAVT